MAISFDGENSQINLLPGTTVLSVRELWSRWVDWWLTDDNSKYGIWMVNIGGENIDATTGSMIPVYTFLNSTVKIKPQETSHTLTVSGGVLIVIGGGDPFVDTDSPYTVRINYQQPVQAIGGRDHSEEFSKIKSLIRVLN